MTNESYDGHPGDTFSERTEEVGTLESESADVTGQRYSGSDSAAEQAAEKAGAVAKSAADKAGAVAQSAADKAAEVKDVAMDRGSDVAAVAKDELAQLAQDARAEVQSLWSNASGQLRDQAAAGQQQLSELLHSLSRELGEMASKSENSGPLTALARQGAARGGELSHWLATSEPTEVMGELRRFARRRPFVFLAGAALAGVVVGRLGRGLMAAGEHSSTPPARVAGGSPGSVPVTAGVTTPPPVSYEEVPSFEGDEGDHVESYSSDVSGTRPYSYDGGAR